MRDRIGVGIALTVGQPFIPIHRLSYLSSEGFSIFNPPVSNRGVIFEKIQITTRLVLSVSRVCEFLIL